MPQKPNIDNKRTIPELPVQVERHIPDIDNLQEQVIRRAESLPLSAISSPVVYLNPIATVTCDEPTPAFFRTVRKLQGQWCKRSRTIFGRHTARKARNWHSPFCDGTKYNRALDRALCFTGIILWRGKLMFPHRWAELENKQ